LCSQQPLHQFFVDAGDPTPTDAATEDEPTTLADLDFSQASASTVARRRFKKILPGIINVRTDGDQIFAFRWVQQGYQWESYGPSDPSELASYGRGEAKLSLKCFVCAR
jgi:hypothetical protein